MSVVTRRSIAIVDYLILDGEPHLRANQCTSCGAKFFDRRNACASCGATDFATFDVETIGVVRAFTIVAMAAPGVAVPYAAAIIDCGGTDVRGNIVNTPADPDHITLGMKVRLTTAPIGTDSEGTEAIGFAFGPA